MLMPRPRKTCSQLGCTSTDPGVSELFVEMHVEVAHQHFVAGHCLVAIVVGEGQHRLLAWPRLSAGLR